MDAPKPPRINQVNPGPVFSFEKIKSISIPYEDIEQGVVEVCRAINSLPFAVTTGMSGGAYLLETATKLPGKVSFNFGHVTIGLDEKRPESKEFLKQIRAILEKYPRMEIIPFTGRDGHVARLARSLDGTELICEAWEVQIKDWRNLDHREHLKRMRGLTKDPSIWTDEEFQHEIRKLDAEIYQVEEKEALEAIRQFDECMTDIRELCRKSFEK